MLRYDYSIDSIKDKKAIFVDCDGTIADTMPAHNKAYELAFMLNDVPFSKSRHEQWAPFGGKKLMEETVIKYGYGHKVNDIINDKQMLLDFCLKKYMRPNKKLIDIIRSRPADIKCYVVSNGRRPSITKVLNHLGILFSVDGLITPEILGTVKPSPEPYNYAMVLASIDLKTKITPEDVIVFEDNNIGIDSAQDAGITDIIKVVTNEF